MARYYDKINRNERQAEDLPNVVELPPSNVFWSLLPAGMQFTYDGSNIPNGLEPIPPHVYTVAEQARIDLRAAGVTIVSITAANYMLSRGDNTLSLLINAAVDAVVVSSGLSLIQVSELV